MQAVTEYGGGSVREGACLSSVYKYTTNINGCPGAGFATNISSLSLCSGYRSSCISVAKPCLVTTSNWVSGI